MIKALSANKNRKCESKLSHFIKGTDEYGEKVEFTFKGKKHYGTYIGAFFTFCVRTVVCIIFGYELYVLFMRKYVNHYLKNELYN